MELKSRRYIINVDWAVRKHPAFRSDDTASLSAGFQAVFLGVTRE